MRQLVICCVFFAALVAGCSNGTPSGRSNDPEVPSPPKTLQDPRPEEEADADSNNWQPNPVTVSGPLNHYEVLGIGSSASAEEIRRAYRGQALRYHPDVCMEGPKCAELFQLVHGSYQVLKDPEARRVYDRELAFNEGRGKRNSDGGRPWKWE